METEKEESLESFLSGCLTWLIRMSLTEVWGVHFGVNNERRVYSLRHRVRIKNS